MSDDFGTVSVKRGDRAREIEVLRGQYRTHRDTLMRLISDAPSEALAAEYQRVIAGIDHSLRKLDELAEGTAPAAAADAFAETQQAPVTSAGNRPLMTPPPPPRREPVGRYTEPEPASTGSRNGMIIAAGIIVLALIGGLVWWASTHRRAAKQTPIVEQPTTTATAEPPVTPAPATGTTVPAAGSGALHVKPAMADYGVIRRGTRGVKQFEVTNTGSAPIDIQVARSNCRCLYYEYNKTVKPGSKETITVTVDGGKAKPGALDEQIAVTSKADPSVSATLEVRAIIR